MRKSPPTTAIRMYDGPLRTADGQMALLQHGTYFSSSQGEWHVIQPRQFASIEWQIGLVHLNNGNWLASHTGCATYSDQYSSRLVALRSAVASKIRLARAGHQATDYTASEYRAVVAWCFSLLNLPAPTVVIIEKLPPPLPLPLGQIELFAGETDDL